MTVCRVMVAGAPAWTCALPRAISQPSARCNRATTRRGRGINTFTCLDPPSLWAFALHRRMARRWLRQDIRPSHPTGWSRHLTATLISVEGGYRPPRLPRSPQLWRPTISSRSGQAASSCVPHCFRHAGLPDDAAEGDAVSRHLPGCLRQQRNLRPKGQDPCPAARI
jgi:hypothetical protein